MKCNSRIFFRNSFVPAGNGVAGPATEMTCFKRSRRYHIRRDFHSEMFKGNLPSPEHTEWRRKKVDHLVQMNSEKKPRVTFHFMYSCKTQLSKRNGTLVKI